MILPKAELTPNGRPKLTIGEVERLLLDKVDIEFEGSGCTEGCAAESVYKNGYCVVTSHRILWIDAAATSAPGRSCHMPLETIHSVTKRVQYGFNLMNPKIRLEMQLYVDRNFKITSMQASATFKVLHLRCRGEAPDTFQEQLSTALQAHRAMAEQQQQHQQRLLQQQQHQQQQQLQQQQQAGLQSHPLSLSSVSMSSDSPPLLYQQNATPWAALGPHSNSAPSLSGQQQHQGLFVSTHSAGPSSSGGGAGLPPRSPLTAAGPRSPGGASASARGLQAVDADLLEQLVDMGFPRFRVMRALVHTNNTDLQSALDWILAAGEDPAMDQPLPFPEPAVVNKQELQRLKQMHLLQQPQQPNAFHQGPQQQLQQQQLASGWGQELAPGWGVGSVSAAAAAGGGCYGGSSGAGGGSGSWGPVGPLTAALVANSSGGGSSSCSSSPRRASGLSVASGGSLGFGSGPPPAAAQAAAGGGSGSSSRVVGVAGIMTREAEKNSQTAANLAVAFQDLNNLMGMAAEMVKLAEKFRGVMGPDGSITLNPPAAATATGGSGSSSEPTGAEAAAAGNSSSAELLLDAETQLQLIAMGITSPVTRASAGARYHQELARQLADFLAAPLGKAGGVMMLPDVYCLFNRARGTELVSPDDLMQACEAFQQVGLPLRLRKFPSGVLVVQGSQFSDRQLCRSIEQVLQAKSQGGAAAVSGGGAGTAAAPAAVVVAGLGPALSAADVSAALALPLTLAKEALLVAESAGVLCRDDGPEGLRFFRNFFVDAAPLAVR